MQSGFKKAISIGSAVLVALLAVPLTGQAEADGTTVSLSIQGNLIFARGEHFPADTTVDVVALVENGTGATDEQTDEDGKFTVAFALPTEFGGGPVKIAARTEGVSAESTITVAKASTTTTAAAPVEAITTSAAPAATAAPALTAATQAPSAVQRAASAPAIDTAPAIGPSQSAPTQANGWRQIFREDFNTDLNRGSWPGPYSNKWTSYDGFAGTYGTSDYEDDILSVSNGNLDMFLHTGKGRALTAAPVPITSGKAYEGHQYGRFSVRFRADSLPGYKTAWLMWPDTDKWTSEIDFPEGELSGTINAFNHCPGNASKNCSAFDTGVTYTGWHVATTEWTADSVKFYLDDKLVGTDTNSPQEPMHWVLQTEGDAQAPNPNVSGHVQIDWVAAWVPA